MRAQHVPVFALMLPILLTACGSSESRTTHRLQDRLQERLAAPIAAQEAALTQEPNGATITLLQPPRGPDLDERNAQIAADVIQGLLDPGLMRIRVAESAVQDSARVRALNNYFEAFNLGSSLRPALAEPAPTAPNGLTIRIAVECPRTTAGWNWGYRPYEPACDR